MTVAMWLAWLLRDDVRAGAPISHPEMQREFVVWWLLWGRTAFPGSWWYGAEQLAVAMEPVAAAPGLGLPRLLRQVHRARADLGAAFPLADGESRAELLCWYRLFGPRELAGSPALPHAAMLETERPSRRPPWNDAGSLVSRMAVVLHRVDPAINAGFDPQHPQDRAALADWYNRTGRGAVRPLQPPPDWPEIVPPEPSRRRHGAPSGVNIVGYVHEPSGVGEDARMLAAALAAAAVPTTRIDVAPEAAAAAPPPAAQLTHPATIFCLSAFDTARLFLEHGAALFAGRRNIGAWPWELPAFPPAWADVFSLVDEIWAASRFTAASFAALSPKPVCHLPPAVAFPAVRPARRGVASLPPAGIFVFVYPFDPRSFLTRKNPAACVAAFRLSFPPSDRSVALLLRPNGEPAPTQAWADVLAACAGDSRIAIDPIVYPRDRALALLAACDCLVSPHRAEGFGRNIAEAILVEVPILATGFSGCVDYLLPRERLRWTARRVAPGEYPFGEGAVWAEPSVEHLGERMRQVRQHAGTAASGIARQRRAQAFAEHHSPAAAGRRYAAILCGGPAATAVNWPAAKNALHTRTDDGGS